MATIYQRVTEFQKTHHFRFNLKGLGNLGMIVGNRYRAIHGPIITYSMTQSIEPEGTFMVKDYPDSFTSEIDKCIAEYVAKVIANPKKKPPAKSIPPPKKQRTRKPVPAFSLKK